MVVCFLAGGRSRNRCPHREAFTCIHLVACQLVSGSRGLRLLWSMVEEERPWWSAPQKITQISGEPPRRVGLSLHRAPQRPAKPPSPLRQLADGITDTASLDFRVPGSMYVQASMLCASALYTTPDKTGNPVGTIYLIRNLSPSST